MNGTIRPKYVPNPPSVPITTGNRNRQGTAPPPRWRAAAEPAGRRFDRVAIGFWLGGLALGTAGCLLGACMPYRHPVAVTISMLWWGVFLGCFGASIGAGVGGLFGLWPDDTPASPPRAGTSGHRSSVQAASGATALADLTTSLVRDDRNCETPIGCLGM
jgi:hypothetical protein